MAALGNSSSSSSSSSYRYSSSSFRASSSSSEGQEPLFQPYLDGSPHSLFGEEGAGTPLLSFSRPHRESFGYSGGAGRTSASGRPASTGAVQAVADSYLMSADVSQYEPHDVVIMAYSHWVVIHAEKVADDGSVSDTFTHKSQLPEDMDPLSLSSTLSPEGILVVSVRKMNSLEASEAPRPAYHSVAQL